MKGKIQDTQELEFVSATELPVGRICADHAYVLLKVSDNVVMAFDKKTGTMARDHDPSKWNFKRRLQPTGTALLITT